MPKNHIRIEGERSCAPALLARLRELDPELDLHYLGEGRWALGAVRWNTERYWQAGMLRREGTRLTVRSARLAELGMQGFARIAIYEIQGEPTSAILNDFRERDYRYRQSRERAYREALSHAMGDDAREASKKAAVDEMESRVADSYGNFFRGRRSFDMGRVQ